MAEVRTFLPTPWPDRIIEGTVDRLELVPGAVALLVLCHYGTGYGWRLELDEGV